MKKTLLALLVFSFVISLCFAQKTSSKATPQTPKTAAEAKTFTGKVDAVSLGNAAKKTKPHIVVTDDQGQKMTFAVRHTTTILGSDGKAINLEKIAKGTKVTIDYVIGSKSRKKAKSIKVIE